MTPDIGNSLFEAGGAYFIWKNVFVLLNQKQIRGVYWPAWLFFALWGLWNLWYYPSLSQWLSFAAGIVLVSGNILWCILAFRYRRN